MNAELIAVLNTYGQSTVQQIQDHLASTGTNATGKTSSSLKYTVTQEGTKVKLQITGRPFFAVVETGRKATPSYEPLKAFVQTIKEWAQAKGIETKHAYAIAKSIHKKGTKLHQRGGRSDIYSNVINQNLVDKIALDLLDKFARQFLTNVTTLFQNGTDNFRTA